MTTVSKTRLIAGQNPSVDSSQAPGESQQSRSGRIERNEYKLLAEYRVQFSGRSRISFRYRFLCSTFYFCIYDEKVEHQIDGEWSLIRAFKARKY